MEEIKQKNKYSDCCGATYDDDIAICAECFEHCGFWEEEYCDLCNTEPCTCDEQYEKARDIKRGMF